MARFRATIKIRLRRTDPVGRNEFWQEFKDRLGPGDIFEQLGGRIGFKYRGREHEFEDSSYPERFETIFREMFVTELSSHLNFTLGGAAILFKGFEYGSFDSIFDIIPGIDAFTVDDLISVLMTYTPITLNEIFGQRVTRELVVNADVRSINGGSASGSSPRSEFERRVVATTGEPPPPAGTSTESAQSESRLAKLWRIANFSLVLPAAILLAAAILLFYGAQDEKRIMLEAAKEDRGKFTQALVAERDQLDKSVLEQTADLRAVQASRTVGGPNR